MEWNHCLVLYIFFINKVKGDVAETNKEGIGICPFQVTCVERGVKVRRRTGGGALVHSDHFNITHMEGVI